MLSSRCTQCVPGVGMLKCSIPTPPSKLLLLATNIRQRTYLTGYSYRLCLCAQSLNTTHRDNERYQCVTRAWSTLLFVQCARRMTTQYTCGKPIL